MESKWIPFIEKFSRDEYVRILKLVWGGYWLGGCGELGTQTVWDRKCVQKALIDWYKRHADAFKRWVGKPIQDCIGIDKGIRWGNGTWDDNIPYQSDTDLNESMLYNLAKELKLRMGPISTLPKEVGLCVGYSGHIGFTQEIKNGKVFVKESRGGDWGVVTYEVGKRPVDPKTGKVTQWQYWFENPFVDYGGRTMLERGAKGDKVIIWQRFLKSKKYNIGTFGPNKDGLDGSFGRVVETAQRKWELDNKLNQDGKVDFSDCMFALNDSFSLGTEQYQKQITLLENDVKELKSNIANLNVTHAQEVAGLSSQINVYKNKLTECNKQLVESSKQTQQANQKLTAIKDAWKAFKSYID